MQQVKSVCFHLAQASNIAETDLGAPKAIQMSALADSQNSLRRVRQLPDAPQQLLLTRIRANDAGVDPGRAIPRVFVAGAVFGDRPQNGRGWACWLGWAELGLQEAGGRMPEDSVPFGRGPPG